jgi:hypothetical protein
MAKKDDKKGAARGPGSAPMYMETVEQRKASKAFRKGGADDGGRGGGGGGAGGGGGDGDEGGWSSGDSDGEVSPKHTPSISARGGRPLAAPGAARGSGCRHSTLALHQ